MNVAAILAAALPLAQKLAPEIGLLGLAVYHAVAKHDKASAFADLFEAAQELGILPAGLSAPSADPAPAQAPAS